MVDPIHITVVYAPAPRQVTEVEIELAAGASARQAVVASGLLAQYPELAQPLAKLGVWGHKVDWNHVLRHQDRLELYRPLKVDPKVARRARFRKQGSRGTGLFARRPG